LKNIVKKTVVFENNTYNVRELETYINIFNTKGNEETQNVQSVYRGIYQNLKSICDTIAQHANDKTILSNVLNRVSADNAAAHPDICKYIETVCKSIKK